MIVISENVRLLSLVMIYSAITISKRVIHILISSQVICGISTISANVSVLLEEGDIFKLLLDILIYHLAENISWKSLKLLITTILQIDIIIQTYNYMGKMNKCVFPKSKIFK